MTFLLKNDGEKWPRLFYFEIQRGPSELLLPSAKMCPERLNWPSKYLWRGSLNFKKKNLDHFSTLFFNQKCSFMTVDFSTLIERVLASVNSIRIMQWIKGSTQFYEILSFPNYVNVPKVSLYLKGIFPRLYTVQSWFSDIKFSDN